MTRIAFLIVSLLSVPALVSAEPLNPAVDSDRANAQDEFYLLNHRVAMPPLVVWDGEKSEWRAPLGSEANGPTAAVRVVHLWATYCKPCEEEFPLLKQMDQQFRRDYKGAVQFVYIADAQSSAAEMRKFIDRNHPRMPPGPLFQDSDNKLSADVLSVLPQRGPFSDRIDTPSERQLMFPMTLVIDSDNVVRLAFAGSLLHRRAAIVNGIAQLQRTLAALPPGKSNLAAKKQRSLQ